MIKLYNILPEHVIKPRRPLETIVGSVGLDDSGKGLHDFKVLKNIDAHRATVDFVKSENPTSFSVYLAEPGVYYCFLYSHKSTSLNKVIIDTTSNLYDITQRYFSYWQNPGTLTYTDVADFHDAISIKGKPVARNIEDLESLT